MYLEADGGLRQGGGLVVYRTRCAEMEAIPAFETYPLVHYDMRLGNRSRRTGIGDFVPGLFQLA